MSGFEVTVVLSHCWKVYEVPGLNYYFKRSYDEKTSTVSWTCSVDCEDAARGICCVHVLAVQVKYRLFHPVEDRDRRVLQEFLADESIFVLDRENAIGATVASRRARGEYPAVYSVK